jgi:hypothetical protein
MQRLERGRLEKISEAISSASPLSIELAARMLDFGSSNSLSRCLQKEYSVVKGLMGTEGFYLGVKSVFVDKKPPPSWGGEAISADNLFDKTEYELSFTTSGDVDPKNPKFLEYSIPRIKDIQASAFNQALLDEKPGLEEKLTLAKLM